MVDHTIAETLYRIGRSEDVTDYFEVMDTRLRVQARPLDGSDAADTEISIGGKRVRLDWAMEIPLAPEEVEVNVLIENSRHRDEPFARTFVVKADGFVLFLEADHRGPEHGVDAWIGEDETPDAVVTELELVNGGGDRD